MLWMDRAVAAIKFRYQDKISQAEPIIIRDEKTLSGRVHVGSMRGAAIHGIIGQVLAEEGVGIKFLWENNDFDAFDAVPSYLDQSKYAEYIGKPLYQVPSPDPGAQNYADYFAREFNAVIEETGFHPQYYRSSEAYRAGKYNEAIRIALEQADKIRKIYKEVSGSEKGAEWLPIMVICERCGKIATTRSLSFDGREVEYVCAGDTVEWTRGCGHRGRVSPFDGRAKLPWKVEWAAKFKVFGVNVEGAGKDLSTRGGARDIANHISREVFDYEPPYDIPYEFFLIGGAKMSTSAGNAAFAREVADLLPPHIFRLLLLGKNPKQAIDFTPDGDTIPILFDWYDKLAEKYFAAVANDDTRLFKLSHLPEEEKKLKTRFLPRFSQVAFLVQMPHIELEREAAKIKGGRLTPADKKELERRADYARRWLSDYALDEYKYELQEEIPAAAKKLSREQKQALRQVLEYIKSQSKLDGPTLHAKLHQIKTELKIDPKELFSAIYLAFLGRDSGPQAGWFLSVLDRDFLIKRLEQVTK